MVIQFWKIGDFLFFSSSWQVLEESAILCGFRFIPAIFQQHTSQLLTVKELFHSVILESAIEKGSQYTDQSCQNDSQGYNGWLSDTVCYEPEIYEEEKDSHTEFFAV